MNFGSTSLRLLEALPVAEPPRSKLLACKKIVRTLRDDLPNEATHRLCQKLRALLKGVVEDTQSTTDERQQASSLLNEVRLVDPRRRKAAEKAGTTELNLAEVCSTTDATPRDDTAADSLDDPWLNPPPLPHREWRRLFDCVHPFEVHTGGDFRLKSDADAPAMLKAVLDGRPPTLRQLKRLYLHLTESSKAGGPYLAHGTLYTVLKKILLEQNALPPEPQRCSVLQELIDEGTLETNKEIQCQA